MTIKTGDLHSILIPIISLTDSIKKIIIPINDEKVNSIDKEVEPRDKEEN